MSKDNPCTASNKEKLLNIGPTICVLKIELRAYLRARVMSKVQACSYRVVDQTTNDVKAIVRDGQDFVG